MKGFVLVAQNISHVRVTTDVDCRVRSCNPPVFSHLSCAMLSTLSKPVVLVIAVVVLSVVAVLVYVRYRALLKNERYQALQKLCRLSPQAIDAYFDSYGKIFEDHSMVSTLADYRAGKPASRFAIKDNPDKQAEYTEDKRHEIEDAR